jgi:glycosyltransferase involved in cell wall biosynthesis
MRVLMISDVYFPRVNGVSTSIQTFRRELRHGGHSVTLVAPRYAQPACDEEGIVRIEGRAVPRDPEDRLMQVGALRRFTDRLERGQFDVVHIQTPFLAHHEGVRVARRLRVPCVESYHTFFEEYFHHYLPFLPRALTRMFARWLTCKQCNRLDGLVVPSRVMLEVLRGYGVRANARVIPTGLQPEQFRQGDGRRFRLRHGIAADRPLLVHVGRVAFEKNIEFLLRMLPLVRAAVPEVLLVIAGEGPALAGLRHMVRRLRLDGSVQFVRYLSRTEELPDCYGAGDLFVFASNTETQGLVLLEAMALGLPVVSTGLMGAGEVLRDGAGAAIVEAEEAVFARRVVSLLVDAPRRLAMGEAARAYAASWTSARFAAELIEYYELLISRQRLAGESAGESALRDDPTRRAGPGGG